MIAKARQKFHEFVDLFPAMTPDEREKLKENIQAHGVQSPVVIYNDMVADGRHRVEIATELGITYPTVEFEGTEHELLLHIMSLNFHRRHLTQGQKAAIVASYRLLARDTDGAPKPGPKPGPKNGSQQDAKRPNRVNGNDKTVNVSEIEEAASAAGVGKTALWQAEKVGKERPDLLKEVVAGQTSLRQAHQEVTNPKPDVPLPRDDSVADAANSDGDDKVDADAEIHRDCLGHELPIDLIPIFADFELAGDIEKNLKAALRGAKELCEVAAGVFIDKPGLCGDIRNAIKEIQAKRPYTVCPGCDGRGCHQCEHNGWMGESRFKQFTDAERNDWIASGKADRDGHSSDPASF